MATLHGIIYKIKDSEIIKGIRFNVLLKNHNDFGLIDLNVYAGGELECLGPITLDKLREHFKTGRLTLTLPPNGRLFIPNIGYARSENSTFEHPISEKEHEKFFGIS